MIAKLFKLGAWRVFMYLPAYSGRCPDLYEI